MPRKSYQQQIEDLRTATLEMSEAVVDQLETAVTAFEQRDATAGQAVADGDEAINDRYLEIESDCVELLALQQPVAGDLRFVVATFKIVTDLERVGDLAANIGQYAVASERDRYPAIDVGQIGSVAVEMIEDATAAYADDDTDRCRAVAERDDHLDTLCDGASRTVTEDLLAANVSEDEVEGLLGDVRWHLLTLRDLERAGDHAVNVAARTLYAVENDSSLLR